MIRWSLRRRRRPHVDEAAHEAIRLLRGIEADLANVRALLRQAELRR